MARYKPSNASAGTGLTFWFSFFFFNLQGLFVFYIGWMNVFTIQYNSKQCRGYDISTGVWKDQIFWNSPSFTTGWKWRSLPVFFHSQELENHQGSLMYCKINVVAKKVTSHIPVGFKRKYPKRWTSVYIASYWGQGKQFLEWYASSKVISTRLLLTL